MRSARWSTLSAASRRSRARWPTAWRAWRDAVELRDSAAGAAQAFAAERELLDARRRELEALDVTADEWTSLDQAQSRLAHAAALLEAAAAGEDELADSDARRRRRVGAVIARLQAGAAHDPALGAIVALLEPARIQLDEAARALRHYRQKLDLDPGELARVEERLTAIHDTARRYRVRPDVLPELLAETEARLAAIAESADVAALAKRVAETEATLRALADELTKKRSSPRASSRIASPRRCRSWRWPAAASSRARAARRARSYGQEQVEFRVASHPKQPLGPLARVASGGELSRLALAIAGRGERSRRPCRR